MRVLKCEREYMSASLIIRYMYTYLRKSRWQGLSGDLFMSTSDVPHLLFALLIMAHQTVLFIYLVYQGIRPAHRLTYLLTDYRVQWPNL